MTKERLRVIIGENIRGERVSRGISIDELSEMLDLTPGFVGLIERGQRGTTSSTLFKLADVFEISIDSLFQRKEGSVLSFGEESDDRQSSKRRKVASFISDFSEEELDFVLATLKGLRNISRPQKATYDDVFDEAD